MKPRYLPSVLFLSAFFWSTPFLSTFCPGAATETEIKTATSDSAEPPTPRERERSGEDPLETEIPGTIPRFLGRAFWGNVVAAESPDAPVVADSDSNSNPPADATANRPESLRLSGHNGPVNALAFTDDYKHLLTGGDDRRIILWNADTGEIVRRYAELRGRVSDLAVAKDGNHFISSTSDGRVSLWDLNSEEKIRDYPRLETEPEAVAVDSSVSTVVAATQDGQIAIFRGKEPNTPPGVQSVRGHLRGINTVDFSPDGRRFLTGGQDRVVTIWDTDRGEKILNFRGHQHGAVLCAAFSPDGKHVVSAGTDVTLILWDGETGNERLRIAGGHLGPITAVAFHPEAQRVMTASRDRTVAFWDVNTGTKLAVSKRRDSVILDAAMNPRNETVAVACLNGAVEILSPEAFSGDFAPSDSEPSEDDAESPEASIQTSSRRLIDESLLELPRAELILRFRRASDYADFGTISRDASSLVLLNASRGESSLWNPETGTLERFFHPPSIVFSTCFHVKDSRFLLLGLRNGSVVIWNSRTEKPVETIPLGDDPVCALVLSNDASRLLAGTTEGKVMLWSFRDKKVVREFRSEQGRIVSLAFSPDDRFFALGGESAGVELYDTKDFQRRVLGKHTQGQISVAFTPNAAQLVSAASDGKAVLWDVATGRVVREFLAHRAAIASLAVSPDGSLLLTGGGPEEMSLLWDMDTAKPLMILPYQGGAVTSAMFHPKQLSVYTVGGRTPLYWDIGKVRR